ncbi:class I SAM-dependent methyltransferase [Candidatus Kaiserbacteria bacterium]|nr:class I SAM-dependent methyltransferase [Candidatus Kaiserbacteria bacterium]
MIEHLTPKFDKYYANKYERLSGDIRAYETWARTLAGRLLEHKPDAKEVLEIGSGTGNSAVVLLETAPSIEHVYGIEVGDFILVADAKRKGTVEEYFSPQRAPAYSLEMMQRMQAHKDKFKLIQAKGEAIPIRNGSMDVVFMNQVFHWLDADKALKEIHSVLKPDGLLIFDESESQFDFGDSAEGRRIKAERIINHPFMDLFERNFSSELRRHGIQSDARPLEYIFTLESLKALLERHHFQLIPDARGNPYTIAEVRYNLDQMMSQAENGARMRIMRTYPQLLETPHIADEVVSSTMEKTQREWLENPHEIQRKYGPSQAVFVTRKMSAVAEA